ncbi:DUF4278 domain-containing protein [Pantanalinema rosaneae CENA516]|uniref:DUF4278 domain-containing protein n=1 Tax=Pantanalinema rosaneae TaxID=1620701 RepID=UPI003D6E3A79
MQLCYRGVRYNPTHSLIQGSQSKSRSFSIVVLTYRGSQYLLMPHLSDNQSSIQVQDGLEKATLAKHELMYRRATYSIALPQAVATFYPSTIAVSGKP